MDGWYDEPQLAPRTVWLQPDLDDPDAPSNQGEAFKNPWDYPRDGEFGRPARELTGTTDKPNGGNLVSSMTVNGDHRPVIDIDGGCQVVPSKTPGHFHLYIDKAIDWNEYRNLLWALVRCGLVEPNYLRAAEDAQKTFVRLDPQSRPDRSGRVAY
jgi:hypothetical protein